MVDLQLPDEAVASFALLVLESWSDALAWLSDWTAILLHFIIQSDTVFMQAKSGWDVATANQ